MPKIWNKLTKGASWGALSTLAKAGGQWLLMKALALNFGPAGVSLHAQVVNLITIFLILPQQGVGLGLVKLLPNYKGKEKQVWAIAIRIGLLLIVSVGILLLLAQLLGLFKGIGYPLPWYWWAVFLCCVLAFMFHQVFLYLLQGLQQFKAFALLAAVGSTTAALLAWLFGNTALGLSLLALPLGLFTAASAAGIYFLWKKPIPQPTLSSIHLPKEKGLWKQFMPFIWLALTTWAANGVNYGIRTFSIQQIGLVETSYWQAPATLSNYYVTAFTTTVLFVFYPTLTKKIAERNTLS